MAEPTLADRTHDLELVLLHLSSNSYAPSHPNIVDAMSRLRKRCAPSIQTEQAAPVPSAEPSLADRVFTAAAEARSVRASADALREQGAGDDAILEAQIAAEEAETLARELSEQARDAYGTGPTPA